MVHRVENPARRTSERDTVGVASAVASEPERDYPDHLDAGLLKITSVCVLAAIMTILDTTVVNVAQRTFISQFGSTQAVVAWTATGYTLALAAVIPLTGWAADRFGTKRLFIGSIVLFTAGSLLCAVASDITQLIAFRVLQGLGGGMLMPLKFTISHPRGWSSTTWAADVGVGDPDAVGSGGRPHLGRVAHRRPRVALDFPDQRADRARLGGAGRARAGKRSSVPVGVV